MSEYQYYEFLAVDQPLTTSQIARLHKISSRAEIGPTSFINEYHYGDFKGDAVDFLKNYFDAFIYTANWGSRQFMFRVPRDLVDLKTIEPYCNDSSLNVTPAGKWLIINMCLQPDDGGRDYFEESGAGLMASLIALRAEVISGDYRSLYLAWLLDVELQNVEDDEPQPPIPPGLAKLTAAQSALVDFLTIDEELIAVAALESNAAQTPAPDLAKAIACAPVAEKDSWLLELMENDAPYAALGLKSKLAATMPKVVVAQTRSTKTAVMLREIWLAKEKEGEEQERITSEMKLNKAAAEALIERERELDKLSQRIPAAWRSIDQFINLRNQDGYKQAAKILKDLKALAARPGGKLAGFRQLLTSRAEEHARKGSFISELKKAGLI